MRKKLFLAMVTVCLVIFSAQVAFGTSVYVNNFSELVSNFMEKIWDTVVDTMDNNHREIKDIAKSKGYVANNTDSIDTYDQRIEAANNYVAGSKMQKYSMFNANRSKQINNDTAEIVNKMKQSTVFLNFAEASKDSFHSNVAMLPSLMTLPAEGVSEKMTDMEKRKVAIQDVSHNVRSYSLLVSAAGLGMSHDLQKKYAKFDSTIDSWDGAYSDAVIKDVAKMLYDNLNVQIAILRVLASNQMANVVSVQ